MFNDFFLMVFCKLFLQISGIDLFTEEKIKAGEGQAGQQNGKKEAILLGEDVVKENSTEDEGYSHDEIWGNAARDALLAAGGRGKFADQSALGGKFYEVLAKFLADLAKNAVKKVIFQRMICLDAFQTGNVDLADLVNMSVGIANRAGWGSFFHGMSQ